MHVAMFVIGLGVTAAIAQTPSPRASSPAAAQLVLNPVPAFGVSQRSTSLYQGPFRISLAPAQRPTEPGPAAVPHAKVVCGMVVVTVDPAIDAAMIVRPPAAGIDFAARRIAPAVCRQ